MKLCRWVARGAGVSSAQGGRLHEWVGWWEALLELSFTPGKGGWIVNLYLLGKEVPERQAPVPKEWAHDLIPEPLLEG